MRLIDKAFLIGLALLICFVVFTVFSRVSDAEEDNVKLGKPYYQAESLTAVESFLSFKLLDDVTQHETANYIYVLSPRNKNTLAIRKESNYIFLGTSIYTAWFVVSQDGQWCVYEVKKDAENINSYQTRLFLEMERDFFNHMKNECGLRNREEPPIKT